MPHTWRDSVGYWSGLALWTLPSLILVVPGFIILFVALRGIFSRPVNDENHNQEAEQAAP
jgi:cytochrome c-type biogenesis protein CcmH/NrfF